MSQPTEQVPSGQLVPGMHVAPSNYTFATRAAQMPTPAGVARVVVLHVEHGTGSFVGLLPAEFAKAMGHALIKDATGIEVAPSSLVVPHG